MRRLAISTSLSVALLIAAPTAHGDRGHYVARSFVEQAKPESGLTSPLAGFRVLARARIVTPTEWRLLGRQPGGLRFLTPDVRNCRYRIGFTVRSVLAPPTEPADYASAALPTSEPRRLLDSGQRRRSAFRVVREPSAPDAVLLRALRAAVLTQRADIVPAGQVAWSEVRVTAKSQVGNECHAGSWRERVGPQIGDTLATTRTELQFVQSRSD